MCWKVYAAAKGRRLQAGGGLLRGQASISLSGWKPSEALLWLFELCLIHQRVTASRHRTGGPASRMASSGEQNACRSEMAGARRL